MIEHERLWESLKTIYLLKGDGESFVTRTNRLTRGALNDTDGSASQVRGALIIFCAGCFMAVGH